MTVWCMRIECCIPWATHTNSEDVILTAFAPQQWLQEHVSMLRCTKIGCLVIQCNLLLLLLLLLLLFLLSLGGSSPYTSTDKTNNI